jgi:hypothetical protein
LLGTQNLNTTRLYVNSIKNCVWKNKRLMLTKIYSNSDIYQTNFRLQNFKITRALKIHAKKLLVAYYVKNVQKLKSIPTNY